MAPPFFVSPHITGLFKEVSLFMYNICYLEYMGLPRWLNGKESACQHRRHRFNHWVRNMPWRRKGQPAPVFLSGKSQGQGSLAGYSPWGHKESDTTKHEHTQYRIHRCFVYTHTHAHTHTHIYLVLSWDYLKVVMITTLILFRKMEKFNWTNVSYLFQLKSSTPTQVTKLCGSLAPSPGTCCP